MNILNWGRFELPSVFSQLAKHNHPPRVHSQENRRVADALDRPNAMIYNPDAIHFPDHNWATPKEHGLPGSGGYVTCGLNMIAYDHQPKWDRDRTSEAGPVRRFFHDQLMDRRIKHI